MTVAILLTCHNRKDYTLECLRTLLKDIYAQYTVYLVNDGCIDGTEKAVKNEFPQINILSGDGSLFWNRGMYLAFSTAIENRYDFYLWVNDDVSFFEGIVNKLITTYYGLLLGKEERIIVGYTVSHNRKTVTYSGINRVKSPIPLRMGMIQPGDNPIKCDTFHGNCVLIHKTVVDRIGVNEPYYQHGFGDPDYGLRATMNGCEVWLTDYPVGVCEKHKFSGSWFDPSLPILERYHKMTSITNMPPRDAKFFAKRFGKRLWILRFWSPYIKVFCTSILYKIKIFLHLHK